MATVVWLRMKEENFQKNVKVDTSRMKKKKGQEKLESTSATRER